MADLEGARVPEGHRALLVGQASVAQDQVGAYQEVAF